MTVPGVPRFWTASVASRISSSEAVAMAVAVVAGVTATILVVLQSGLYGWILWYVLVAMVLASALFVWILLAVARTFRPATREAVLPESASQVGPR
jgi:hypothetical protein